MDSWIAIRSEKMTILNLNDCIVEPDHLKHISKIVGKVTVLLTQFSFANWIGNNADELREVEAKLQDLRFRISLLKPEATIPFASFIYFCNQENNWMNAFAITPQRIAGLGLPGVNFMYPGDEWNSDMRNFHSAEAVERYMNDIAGSKVIDNTPPEVSIYTVQQAIDRTSRIVRSRFSKLLIARIKPFSIYLHDLDKVLIVNPAGTCDVADAMPDTRESARYVMCSQMAWFAFAFSWGWAAMDVSGMYYDRRFKEPNPVGFYLNLLSTECLSFGTLYQTKRTLEFLWAKRHELVYRARTNLNRRRQSAGETDSRQESLAERRAS
jgi:hypothetical protein